jgi:hypothetical protein
MFKHINQGCFFWSIIFLLFISFHSSKLCYSQNIIIPEQIQAALLNQVLQLTPTFAQKSKIRLLIVYDKDTKVKKDQLVYFLGSSMEIKSVFAAELQQNIGNCDVVYFMPGIQESAALCKTHKVLSVTAISSYVEKGLISLGFIAQNGKPTIFVNLKSLGMEDQSLSSEILRIAKIYN